jgi:hypothetical protein
LKITKFITCLKFGKTLKFTKIHNLQKVNFYNFSHLDLINIHLFHDDSNLLTLQNPSLYSTNRKKAMDFVLERYSMQCSNQNDKAALLFIFGDFNFRLNSDSFLKVCFGY